MSRHCRGFGLSISDIYKMVSHKPIHIITEGKYTASGRDESVFIKPNVGCAGITIHNIAMHMVKYHSHGESFHYWEGITEYYFNDEDELVKASEGVFYSCWGT